MKMLWLRALAATLLALGAARGAQAVSLTFFGEDIGSGDGTGIRLLSTPQADAAQASFLASLVSGFSTEGFDGFSPGTPLAALPALTFSQPSGSVTATLTGPGFVAAELAPQTANASGQYPISPHNYISTASAPATLASLALSLTFSQPQSAFGFYGVDIGDFNGQVALDFGLAAGGMLRVDVPHTQAAPGGSALYFARIDTDHPFTSVTFLSTTGLDNLAFDNFTIASGSQVISSGLPTPGVGQPVPEPNTFILLGSGLMLVGLLGWWRSSRR